VATRETGGGSNQPGYPPGARAADTRRRPCRQPGPHPGSSPAAVGAIWSATPSAGGSTSVGDRRIGRDLTRRGDTDCIASAVNGDAFRQRRGPPGGGGGDEYRHPTGSVDAHGSQGRGWQSRWTAKS
jgi:hypothetical protein